MVTPGGNTEPGPRGLPASAALPVVGTLLEGIALLCAETKLESSLRAGAPLVVRTELEPDATGAMAVDPAPTLALLGRLIELFADDPPLAADAETDAASDVELAETGPVSEVTPPLGLDVSSAGLAGDVSQASVATAVETHAAAVSW